MVRLLLLIIICFNLFTAEESSPSLSYRKLNYSIGYWEGGKIFVKIIDYNSNEVINVIKLDTYNIDKVSISYDNKKLIVVTKHLPYVSLVTIRKITTGEILESIEVDMRDSQGGTNIISDILISHDNKKLIIDLGRSIEIRHRSGELLNTIELKKSDSWSDRVLISNDDKKLIIKSDNSVKIRDIDSRKLLKSIKLQEFHFGSQIDSFIRGLLISNDGKKLIVYSQFSIKIIDLSSDELLETKVERYSSKTRISNSLTINNVYTYSISGVIISEDDKKLIINLGDSVEIIDIESGKLLKSLVCKEEGKPYSACYRIYYLSINNNILKMNTQILPIQEFDLDQLDFELI